VKKKAKKTLEDFKKQEMKIGDELADAMIETSKELNYIGKCKKCKGDLVIKKGKFGYFIACDQYPDCDATFKLPQRVPVKATKKECEKCGHPTIQVGSGRKTRVVCINPDCETKQSEDKAVREEMAKIDSGEIKKSCPNCEKGYLVVRKSVYGQFYGCDQYPKCKYTQNADDDGKEKKKFPKKSSEKDGDEKEDSKKKGTKKKAVKKKAKKKAVRKKPVKKKK